jgi:hypothetical protein
MACKKPLANSQASVVGEKKLQLGRSTEPSEASTYRALDGCAGVSLLAPARQDRPTRTPALLAQWKPVKLSQLREDGPRANP